MNTICTKTAELERFMKDNLKPSRYTHSLGVEKMASELAAIYGEDTEKAAFAGRYHDIAKCFTPEVMNGYVRQFGLPEIYIEKSVSLELFDYNHENWIVCFAMDRVMVPAPQ